MYKKHWFLPSWTLRAFNRRNAHDKTVIHYSATASIWVNTISTNRWRRTNRATAHNTYRSTRWKTLEHGVDGSSKTLRPQKLDHRMTAAKEIDRTAAEQYITIAQTMPIDSPANVEADLRQSTHGEPPITRCNGKWLEERLGKPPHHVHDPDLWREHTLCSLLREHTRGAKAARARECQFHPGTFNNS